MPSVLIQCDVRCDCVDEQPRYRIWVRDELFAERRWRWGQDHYLQEQIAICALPGRYRVRIDGDVTAEQWTVLQGSAQVDQQGQVRIDHEST